MICQLSQLAFSYIFSSPDSGVSHVAIRWSLFFSTLTSRAFVDFTGIPDTKGITDFEGILSDIVVDFCS